MISEKDNPKSECRGEEASLVVRMWCKHVEARVFAWALIHKVGWHFEQAVESKLA